MHLVIVHDDVDDDVDDNEGEGDDDVDNDRVQIVKNELGGSATKQEKGVGVME